MGAIFLIALICMATGSSGHRPLVVHPVLVPVAGHHPSTNTYGVPPQLDSTTETLVGVLDRVPHLQTVAAALDLAEMRKVLQEEGPFTLFAPNNVAFAKVNRNDLKALLRSKPDLQQVLKRHIVDGEAVNLSELSEGSQLMPTLGGEYVTVMKMANGTVSVTSSIGQATVRRADISADNGVMHIIDGLL